MSDNKDFLEKTLEDILFESSNDELNKRGLPICGIKRRQVRIGNYGVADLITCERINGYHPYRLDFTIYELKKGLINEATFFQCIRYARGLKRYLENHRNIYPYKIDIVLIGNKIDTNDCVSYLPELFKFCDCIEPLSVKIFTYKYKFDGISFNNISGYKLKNEGF